MNEQSQATPKGDPLAPTKWATGNSDGPAVGPLFSPYPVTAMKGREQRGYGLINLCFGFINPDGSETWTSWVTDNFDGHEVGPVRCPNGHPATGIEVVNENRYGLVDARLIYDGGAGAGYHNSLTAWLTNNNKHDLKSVSVPLGKNISGVECREQGTYGLIDARLIYNSEIGLLANNGDLDPKKNKAWAATISKEYYAHKFVNDTIPIAINPVDDREEGEFSERYSTLRNANVDFVKFLADIIAWEADLLHVSSNFFKNLPTPEGATAKLYQNDEAFALFILRGPDPTTLELVTKETKLPFSNFKSDPPGLERYGALPVDFDSALQEGRVFHVDFSKYATITSPGRFASWPHAIFMSFPGKDSFGNVVYRLRPIAISLIPPGLTSKEAVTIFPNTNTHETLPCTWEVAKRVFLSAAANYHELGTHLGRCHMVMERYALATYRNLPPWHPVGRLLRPHFKFMVATNNDAFKNLINTDGPVDRSFMARTDELIKISLDAFSSWNLKTHGGIEADLERRGLLGVDCKLPFWPYKTYGLQIYKVIQTFVHSYLRSWYGADEASYRSDIALQNWRRALREDYRAGPLMESDASFEDLLTACTNMIWTSGPQHSAVNYSQYAFLADAKTLPFGIQQTSGAVPFEPTRQQIGDQATVIARLSLFRYDKLGVYSTASFLKEFGDLGDPKQPWKLIVDRFQYELKALAKLQVYQAKPWDYRFLIPGDITNSISI